MRVRTDLLSPLLLLFASCGDPRREVDPPAPSPLGAEAIPIRVSGQVALAGSLARAADGAVFLIVRAAGSASPISMRSYLLGDPLWFSRDGGERVLHFGLGDPDRHAGRGATAGTPLELEVRYDPDGLLVTAEGIVRKLLPIRPDSSGISVVLGAEDSRASDSSARGG
jgi:hypothetical protein